MGRVKDKREWTRSDKSQARGGEGGEAFKYAYVLSSINYI